MLEIAELKEEMIESPERVQVGEELILQDAELLTEARLREDLLPVLIEEMPDVSDAITQDHQEQPMEQETITDLIDMFIVLTEAIDTHLWQEDIQVIEDTLLDTPITII